MSTDARIRFTKHALKESLIKLLQDKTIKQITVKELCDLAEVNRATFYKYYMNPYDLLEQIEDDLFADMENLVINKVMSDPFEEITRSAFKIIEDNIKLCRIILSENGSKQFLDKLMRLSKNLTVTNWKAQFPEASDATIEYAFAFIMSGAVGVLERWVDSGMEDTPVELAVIAMKSGEIWFNERRNADKKTRSGLAARAKHPAKGSLAASLNPGGKKAGKN